MLRVLLLLLAAVCVADAAVENVTYMPSRPVPSGQQRLLRELRANLTFDDRIAELAGLIQDDWLLTHALALSGEGDGATQFTRNSNSISDPNGISQAARYVEEKMSLEYGATVQVDYWDSNRGPNIISIFPGTGPNRDTLVILGAHLDNLPSSGRAPGGNDDGSGSAALLAIAQAISEFDAKFDYTLVLEHYSGEEQGLLGSRALARKRAARGDKVLGQIQQDMTAVVRVGDAFGVAFVEGSAVDADLSALVKSAFVKYEDALGPLTVLDRVLSGSSCCSDHQSYKENGFPSVGLIEPRGYTGDPMYHTAGDTVLRPDYSAVQATMVARGVLAAAATLAQLV